MSTSVCYILSNINKALAFEWIAARLNHQRFELHFILLNPGESVIEEVLQEKNILFSRITYHGKKDIPKAIRQIYTYLIRNRIQIVHCHLFDANIAGLLAAKLAGVKKRIYTRHHSTLHHQYFPRAIWYDHFINWLATDIVAISKNVRQILIEKEFVQENKITLIHHGFDLTGFVNPDSEKVKSFSEKYHTSGKAPVIGVIARYTDWKGIQYIIPAFGRLRQTYPQAHLVLANASGNYKTEIHRLLDELPAESYTEIPFENDLFSLYELFDVFVHVPVSSEIEAFGQTYVEALAAGVPSVFTLSGVAVEFIEHEKNALVVPFEDSDSIYKACMRILNHETLKQTLVIKGKKSVQEKFALARMIEKLEKLYLCD